MEYVYAALLLHKLGKEITEEHVKKVVESAGSGVDESQVKSLVASLKGVDIDRELENASLVASTPAPVSSGSHEHAAKKEEHKEEEKHESAAEGLSALFG